MRASDKQILSNKFMIMSASSMEKKTDQGYLYLQKKKKQYDAKQKKVNTLQNHKSKSRPADQKKLPSNRPNNRHNLQFKSPTKQTTKKQSLKKEVHKKRGKTTHKAPIKKPHQQQSFEKKKFQQQSKIKKSWKQKSKDKEQLKNSQAWIEKGIQSERVIQKLKLDNERRQKEKDIKIEKMQTFINQQNKELSEVKEKYQFLKRDNQILEDKLRKIKQQIQEKEQQQFDTRNVKMQKQIKVKKRDNISIKTQVRAAHDQIASLKLRLSKEQEKDKIKAAENNTIKAQLKAANDEIASLNARLADSKAVKTQLKAANDEIANLNARHADNNTIKAQLKAANDEIASLKLSLSKVQEKQKILQLSPQPSSKDLIASQHNPQIEQLKLELLLPSQLLNQRLQAKSYICNLISNKTRHQITKIMSLFKYDPLNPQRNIHSYIDDHPNLLFILELSNGHLLGAFSEARISKRGKQLGKVGLLFSITNQKHFELKRKPDASSTHFDPYHLVFGNSEIRIKWGQGQARKVSTLFGTAQNHFNNQGYKSDILFGEKVQETEFESYEIFEVTFEH